MHRSSWECLREANRWWRGILRPWPERLRFEYLQDGCLDGRPPLSLRRTRRYRRTPPKEHTRKERNRFYRPSDVHAIATTPVDQRCGSARCQARVLRKQYRCQESRDERPLYAARGFYQSCTIGLELGLVATGHHMDDTGRSHIGTIRSSSMTEQLPHLFQSVTPVFDRRLIVLYCSPCRLMPEL